MLLYPTSGGAASTDFRDSADACAIKPPLKNRKIRFTLSLAALASVTSSRAIRYLYTRGSPIKQRRDIQEAITLAATSAPNTRLDHHNGAALQTRTHSRTVAASLAIGRVWRS